MSHPVSPAPGRVGWACGRVLRATWVMATGTEEPGTWPRSALASKFDCFYVHPTDSLAKTANTGLRSRSWTWSRQSSRPLRCLRSVTSGWAYRSQTWPTVEKFLAGDEAVMRSTSAVAYDSVLPAWKWFLARGVGVAPLMLPAGRAGRLAPAQT